MLTLKNIKKSYDGTVILKDVNLDIQGGRNCFHPGFLWQWKNNFAECHPRHHRLRLRADTFDGKDITKVSMEERGFNIVFQDYALFPNPERLSEHHLWSAQQARHFHGRGSQRADQFTGGLRNTWTKKNRAAVRRAEAARGFGKNPGDENRRFSS